MDRSLDEIIGEDTVRHHLASIVKHFLRTSDRLTRSQRNQNRPSGGGRRNQGPGRRRGDRDGVRKVLPAPTRCPILDDGVAQEKDHCANLVSIADRSALLFLYRVFLRRDKQSWLLVLWMAGDSPLRKKATASLGNQASSCSML